jgi:hypothetical protein
MGVMSSPRGASARHPAEIEAAVASAAPTAPPMCGRRSVQSRAEAAAEETAAGLGPRQIDAELGQERGARSCDLAAFIGQNHMPARAELLGQRDADLSGQMVVAGAGAPQLLFTARSRPIARRARDRYVHDGFQHPPDMRAGQPVIVMPALLYEPEQLAVVDHRKMTHPMLRHHRHQLGEAGVGPTREDPPRHHVGHRRANVLHSWR